MYTQDVHAFFPVNTSETWKNYKWSKVAVWPWELEHYFLANKAVVLMSLTNSLESFFTLFFLTAINTMRFHSYFTGISSLFSRCWCQITNLSGQTLVSLLTTHSPLWREQTQRVIPKAYLLLNIPSLTVANRKCLG